MAWKNPYERFTEKYPGFVIATGLILLGHIIYQIAVGKESVGQIGGPVSFQQSPIVFIIVIIVEAVLGIGTISEGIRGWRRGKRKK
jgi:hypothetical protein